MKNILLFGAGKSATVLIDYLLKTVTEEGWQLIIIDADLSVLQKKTASIAAIRTIAFNIADAEKRSSQIREADIVISMLPATLHSMVAEDCLLYGKNLLTASYVDEKIRQLSPSITEKGLLFLCEMGLDPGIDHMSAMKLIDAIHTSGGRITCFKSHCGGLVAPESDDNPWHYKISWNPKNIINAGKAGALYREGGNEKEIMYDKLFEKCVEIKAGDLPTLAWYPNRDSLHYAALYGLEDADTFIRTTLRHPAFCRGWDVIGHLGFTDTDDAAAIQSLKTLKEWTFFKLKGIELRSMDWNEYLQLYIAEDYHAELTRQFEYLELFSEKPVPPGAATSFAILQHILESKWALQPTDKDMVVMLHEIEFLHTTEKKRIESLLVVKGENNSRTAMAKTVGLPLGIAAKLILKNKISLTGLHIPILPEIYEPVLKELTAEGIAFVEKRTDISDELL